ncbi:uncharacterized protein UV8b_01039 [Ustilaginoidea virens]|uniref:Uncharacterized protein n=1 Tax=Ustilaginoidea virens TaxID=1159556 RepID=A0A8E5HK03_USTVR|nr:uncharacterized protein UV8b_01039 [Ustilaginoidea virens]QUC16798.1 hypothetical protein UV8b_01039 [Ustilaginoidea virens]
MSRPKETRALPLCHVWVRSSSDSGKLSYSHPLSVAWGTQQQQQQQQQQQEEEEEGWLAGTRGGNATRNTHGFGNEMAGPPEQARSQGRASVGNGKHGVVTFSTNCPVLCGHG